MHRRPDGKLIVSATDLVGFLECGHLTQLERAAAAGLVAKPVQREDPEVELLQRRGGEHERRYIDFLRENNRVITDLSVEADAWIEYEERAAQTIEAMRRGDDVIFQATMFDGRWVGHPDFLLRVDARDTADPITPSFSQPTDTSGPHPLSQVAGSNDAGAIPRVDSELAPQTKRASGLGHDWIYEVADTKLAHSAKASALIQICSYVDQIERIQGVPPENVYVVTGGAEIGVHDFRTAEMMAYYRHAKRRFEQAIDDAAVGPRTWPIPRDESYPDPVEHCAVCKWFPYNCRVQWRDDDALPLVAGISRRQRELLKANDVTTMHALGELQQPIELEGLKRSQSESIWRMREQARLQVKSGANEVPEFELLEPERDADLTLVADRGLSALPVPSDHDLFFDFEGDPFAFWEGLEYLFGVWDGTDYRGYWALTREEEKDQFELVMDLFHEHWKQHPDMHIYHYGSYEPSRLKQLAGRHATKQDELDDLLRGLVFVDLYRVVQQGVLVGAERYSIKNLEPLYGFKREINLRDANSSIVEFEKLLEFGDPGGELKDLIQGYNKDDTVSTERLRDWLEERRLEVQLKPGEELPRPHAGAVEPPSEELSDRIRAVRELEARLTDALPSDPHNQTDTDKATWLVAHLLEWHRREDKSTWWRYYDLMSKSDDELIDEAEPIGGLEYVEMWELGGRARSNVYRYRFPAQEHKIDVDDSLNDPQLFAAGEKTGTGSVEAIDDDKLTIDIKRPRTWTGLHPKSVVALDVIDAKAQREALMRLGEWIADNGIDSPDPAWRAARDLLLRWPPRLVGGTGGPLGLSGESGSDAARRLAPLLGGTMLAIQGPPGSGKTYIGARMILDLVRGGRKVGISSNSHKVIGNLLEAVLEAARDEQVTVRIVQKGKEGEAVRDPAVRRVEENADVADALASGDSDIAAGTPWLWARPEMSSLVDTLFVDEAGQVSLANVVAMSGSARNVVLLGDPQQLDQPTQGVHPDGAGKSALGHFLGDNETVPVESGVFLEKTWRMHPEITAYTSALFYEGKLISVDGLDQQRVIGDDEWSGAGLRWVEVPHDGNTNASPEEAAKVVEIVKSLVSREWINEEGERRPIAPDDVRVVSPYNAHRLLIDELLAKAGLSGVPVGTVDKFQGQEAAVSIYTMATSRPDDAPRGMGFLYSLNRLNVATSRARALAIVVASPALLQAVPGSPAQLRMANGLVAFVEMAEPSSVEPSAEPVPPSSLEAPVQLEMSLG
jgi:uncharacterized protein